MTQRTVIIDGKEVVVPPHVKKHCDACPDDCDFLNYGRRPSRVRDCENLQCPNPMSNGHQEMTRMIEVERLARENMKALEADDWLLETDETIFRNEVLERLRQLEKE